MNLMMNGTDAMKDVDGTRELAIRSQPAGNERIPGVRQRYRVGLPLQQADQIFNAFLYHQAAWDRYGLSISRSIVESHGGRMWASGNVPRGASFYFTLPIQSQATWMMAGRDFVDPLIPSHAVIGSPAGARFISSREP